MQEQRKPVDRDALDWSRQHMLTLRGRFEHSCSEKALARTVRRLDTMAHLVGQIAFVCDESFAVLSRADSWHPQQPGSDYLKDERSTLPTIDYTTVGRLTEFLGGLDDKIRELESDAERIRVVLPSLVNASLTAYGEGPLDTLSLDDRRNVA